MKILRRLAYFATPSLVPLITVLYGVGDHLHWWWDDLTGRTAALSGWDRLIHGNGYPETFIYNDEAEFAPLAEIITAILITPKSSQSVNKA